MSEEKTEFCLKHTIVSEGMGIVQVGDGGGAWTRMTQIRNGRVN